MSNVNQLSLPIEVGGQIQMITLDIEDATARQAIAGLSSSMKWVGVTTSVLTDGATTDPIVINGSNHTCEIGDVAQYDGTEFAWNGSAWQELGRGDFGTLAYKNSASGSFTPSGSVSITKGSDTTSSITPISNVGSMPYFTYANDTLTYHDGSVPSAGSAISVITSRGNDTATFSGTQGTVTVS